MDIIEGRHFQFAGDSLLRQDGFLRKFHLTPARMLLRISEVPALPAISFRDRMITSGDKRVLLLDREPPPAITGGRIRANVIIISKNPRLTIGQLMKVFDCTTYVFDASNALWKINKWKKDCDNLHLHPYSIPELGAFVMDL